MTKRTIIRFFISAIFTIGVICYWHNNTIATNNYEYENPKIPESFDGFKILQISDWHNKNFGSQLFTKVEESNPNIVVLTGDFIDVYNPNEKLALEFFEKLLEKYPVYFITGNHEKALFQRNYSIQQAVKKQGIIYLDNSSAEITINNETITIYGIKDYTYNKNVDFDMRQTIDKNNTTFSILLAHQPEYFNIYSKYNVDLVLSGHEHGGQIRLPGVGSIYSHQGWFAPWTAGKHELNDSTMIVSRGLGNSKILPIRIFNQPELVTITLKSAKAIT